MKEGEKIKKLVQKGREEERKKIEKILKREEKISFPENEELQKLWMEILRSRISEKENFGGA